MKPSLFLLSSEFSFHSAPGTLCSYCFLLEATFRNLDCTSLPHLPFKFSLDLSIAFNSLDIEALNRKSSVALKHTKYLAFFFPKKSSPTLYSAQFPNTFQVTGLVIILTRLLRLKDSERQIPAWFYFWTSISSQQEMHHGQKLLQDTGSSKDENPRDELRVPPWSEVIF